MTIQFSLTQQSPESADAPCVVVGVFEDKVLTDAAKKIDEKSGGAIAKLLEGGDVTGKIGSTQTLFGVSGVKAPRAARGPG
jgi:leucyl aminopeptidase